METIVQKSKIEINCTPLNLSGGNVIPKEAQQPIYQMLNDLKILLKPYENEDYELTLMYHMDKKWFIKTRLVAKEGIVELRILDAINNSRILYRIPN